MKARSFSPHAASLLAAMLLVLGGCGTSPQPEQRSASTNGALLVVRLTGRTETPVIIQVDVALERGGALAPVYARRWQSVPGRYADYLVAMPLRPTRYVLGPVRDPRGLQPSSRVADESRDASATIAAVEAPFEVPADTPVYLGRLVVPPIDAGGTDGNALHTEDQYDEDTLRFRSAVDKLRNTAIARAVIGIVAVAAP